MYPKPITYFVEICSWAGKIGLAIAVLLAVLGFLPRFLLAFLVLIYLPDLLWLKNRISHKRNLKRIQRRNALAASKT